ncbi:MAG: hypothetical protein DRN19_03640 [Thermoplasmata archaeon]|nr:MAG: hypothetical protein DRN19_03640 [Thermoplasmata archaeon]
MIRLSAKGLMMLTFFLLPIITPMSATHESAEEWCFAIITDLHMGRGYPDYGGEGIEDMESEGEEYYLTQRLERVVRWINENHESMNIKFVAVLGDLADSGEYSEMKKAKEILDGLQVPYLPVIGNHDVWSKVEGAEEKRVGEGFFKRIFNESFIEDELRKLQVEWEEVDIDDLYNYAFEYRNITFLVLDFVDRENPPGHHASLYNETIDSLQKWLNHSHERGIPAIIFSHHPMVAPKLRCFSILKYIAVKVATFDRKDLMKIEEIFRRSGAEVLANFAGHVHGFYDPEKPFIPIIMNPFFIEANTNYKTFGYTPSHIDVVTTEAVMVASNEEKSKGIVRIVKIKDKSIDFDTICGNFAALNPYFKKIAHCGDTVKIGVYAFTKLIDKEHPGWYGLYLDGVKVEERTVNRWWMPVSFKIDLSSHHNLTLEVRLNLPDKVVVENISRSI